MWTEGASADAIELAHRQVAAAAAMLAQHRPAGGGLCSCTRQLPCSVALACVRVSERHSRLLGLTHPTIVLPLVREQAPGSEETPPQG
ncbi:hypothetical protein [Catellatospora tritici]|uniref:hypothetical protein n=1 Tax=Catellatospora tritici TaxID=2851566 RepID=UPI001C2DB6FA|nr:hypothetical protein [Catellatospora tritici]MBV1850673.1 hypothetical protein [Catellatospora tritici]MBV1850926.1 hypothetical protein [Catellatospora tritici]